MPSLHAERSLLIYKLRFNKRGKPQETLRIDDIDGHHLDDLFYRFCNENAGKLLAHHPGHKHASIQDVHRVDGGVICSISSGRSGEPFEVIDVATTNKVGEYDEGKAAMVSSRCFLSCQQCGDGGLLCVEHVVHGAGDTALIPPFKKFLADVAHGAVMKTELLQEPEALDAFLSLEEVEIKYYLEQSDVANTFLSEGDYITFSLKHRRNHPFSTEVLRSIKRKGRATHLFGVSNTVFSSEKCQTSFTLKDRHGKTRTFKINDPLSLVFSEVLNQEGEPPASDELFVRRCKECVDSSIAVLGENL